MSFITAVLLFVLFIWPLGRILRRTGHHGWWAILSIIPVVNVLAIWYWAYKDWPPSKVTAS
ncbi:MAG TPA: hypothetical protein VGC69_12020 [Bordetella sp.]